MERCMSMEMGMYIDWVFRLGVAMGDVQTGVFYRSRFIDFAHEMMGSSSFSLLSSYLCLIQFVKRDLTPFTACFN